MVFSDSRDEFTLKFKGFLTDAGCLIKRPHKMRKSEELNADHNCLKVTYKFLQSELKLLVALGKKLKQDLQSSGERNVNSCTIKFSQEI